MLAYQFPGEQGQIQGLIGDVKRSLSSSWKILLQYCNATSAYLQPPSIRHWQEQFGQRFLPFFTCTWGLQEQWMANTACT